jgi:elongation factor Ts
MSNTEMIRELRALTSAGMKDCKDALEETSWDLQKAVDVIKVKGLNIADGRTGRVASEGLVAIAARGQDMAAMVEVNCQTDFVANSPAFVDFAKHVANDLWTQAVHGKPVDASVEEKRLQVVSTTKENVVIRRSHTAVDHGPTRRVFAYLHSNNRIGVLLTMQAPSESTANSVEFQELGNDLAMQVCAMSPLAVSPDQINQEDKFRQETIFRTQLAEEKKPTTMWDRILEGKFRKWNTEVCLLEQESVVHPKVLVKQVVKNVGAKLGGEVQVVSFVRYQAGEGIEKKQENLAEEVAKLM